MAHGNFTTLVAQCAALALIAGTSPLSASELPDTDEDAHPVVSGKTKVATKPAPAAAKRQASSARTAPAPDATTNGKRGATSATATGQREASRADAKTITPNIWQNLHGAPSPTVLAPGDQPAPSTSLCGSGPLRGLADLDPNAATMLLPPLPGLTVRNLCVRRRAIIADYGFR
ncbi:MAG: hypothetical protein LC098_09455 [Burkholderiales bacterium]|nr:hypothetical protein [Burkholderiales bacterium]